MIHLSAPSTLSRRHLIAYAEVIMGRRAALQYAEPQVSRVLRKEHTHTLKKRCVEQYCVYRLLAHN